MPDRKTPPRFQTDFSFPLIHPAKKSTSNGLPLHVISSGSQQVVKVEVIFNAGKWYENHAGISQLAASMLNKGTDSKSSLEITKAFDQLGVHYDASVGFDFTTISLYGLPEKVINVLPIFTELLQRPSLPAQELDILKSQFIQNLKINLEKTSYLASCLSRENVFGSDHPYGRDIHIDDIGRINIEMVKHYHEQRFSPLTVILSGLINSDIEEKVLKAFSSFSTDSGGDSPKSVIKNPVGTIHKDKPNSVQTSIRLGKEVIQRDHEDYPSLLLFNHALGGFFGSRLMKNIREEKGLTYGIHSSIHTLKHASYFSITTDVKREDKDSAIEEILEELKSLNSTAISQNEFNTVRNHFVGSLQTELSTPFAHAEKARTIILHNLKSTFYNDLLNRIEKLTPGDLVECGQKHLNADSLSIVSVG